MVLRAGYKPTTTFLNWFHKVFKLRADIKFQSLKGNLYYFCCFVGLMYYYKYMFFHILVLLKYLILRKRNDLFKDKRKQVWSSGSSFRKWLNLLFIIWYFKYILYIHFPHPTGTTVQHYLFRESGSRIKDQGPGLAWISAGGSFRAKQWLCRHLEAFRPRPLLPRRMSLTFQVALGATRRRRHRRWHWRWLVAGGLRPVGGLKCGAPVVGHKNTCKRLSAYCLALSRFYDCTQVLRAAISCLGLILLILHVLEVDDQVENRRLLRILRILVHFHSQSKHLAINFYDLRLMTHTVDQFFISIGT